MDQTQSAYIHGVLSKFPSATRNFVGLIVNGLLVLPVVSSILVTLGLRALAAGDATIPAWISLTILSMGVIAGTAALICLVAGSVRLLSAVQAHLRIGQYRGFTG